MSVRRAAEGDGPAISTIVQRAFSHYVPRIGRRPGPMDLDYAALVGRGEAFVRGEPIEAALVARPQDDHLFVSVIAVEPGRQGRGAGASSWLSPRLRPPAVASPSYVCTPMCG